MKIGITTQVLSRSYPDERERLKALAKIGFEAFDYAYFPHANPKSILSKDNWRVYLEELEKTVADLGCVFCQVHAPIRPFGVRAEYEMDPYLEKSFEVCSILKAPYLVVHPKMWEDGKNGENTEKYLELNISYYKGILSLAKKYNVKVVCENMWAVDDVTRKIVRTSFSTMDEMRRCAEVINSEYFGVCLDTGHCNLVNISSAEAVKELGHTLKVLHVHDNAGVRDEHYAPSYGNIDWDAFMVALKEVGYDGVFCSEAHGMTSVLPRELEEEGARLLFSTMEHLLVKHGLR